MTAVFKFRCIMSFKPGSNARCLPTAPTPAISGQVSSSHENSDDETTRPRRLGQLFDRRTVPFCTSTRATPQQKYKGNRSFVFVVSNGHTGTTFFGQGNSWRSMLGEAQVDPNVLFKHEAEPNKDRVRRLPMNPSFCEDALAYVANQKVPQMELALEGYANSTGTEGSTWFGAGHQIVLGMIPALIEVLGDRARFIRVRRNMQDTAYSYAAKRGGPCTSRCKYCLCPLDEASRLPPAEGRKAWEQLSIYQQYLWFVDEVEAQWQAILNSYPNIQHTELNWDKKIAPEEFARIAEFAGVTPPSIDAFQALAGSKNAERDGRKGPKAANEHISSAIRSTKNYTWMDEQLMEYRNIMGFPSNCTKYTCLDDIHQGRKFSGRQ